MIRKLGILIGVGVSLAACTSATKRYEQGQELQREGRSAEAAERFIQALKKDSRLDSARAGLRTAGAAAIATYLRTASDSTTPADAAADAYLAVDDLQRRALEVGIYLVEPNGYAESRRAAFDRAIDHALADARRLAPRGDFSGGLRRLDRALSAYQPGGLQARAIGGGRADVLLAWARADTGQARFRTAFQRVDGVAAIIGATTQQADQARAIQAAALARGTRRVAVVPAWATVAARRELPDDALPALGDALLENPWGTPPPFVEIVPADQVQRDLRRMGLSRRTLNTGEAAQLARVLGADYVVVTEIDSVRRDDMDVRVTRRPARTTRGADTAYVIEEGRSRLFARATFVLIDRDGQRWTDYQPVSASGTSSFMRARYAGDDRTLDLRQAERDLFERGRAGRELARALVEELSPRLAEEVFGEVVRRIP
jgi:tetratricopeptide (TPR) repeat protein